MAELLKVREITIDTMQYKDFATKEEELKVMRFYQNDLNSAKLLINVTHDKVVTDFSTATKVQIAFLKPDGKRVFQDVQNVNQMQGRYYVVLSTQTLIAYGNVIAQLRLTFPNNKVIETCKFVFAVDESIMSDEAMESTNEFPVIQKAIEAGEKLEGVDIDGIIAAGELAKGALPKAGGTMTGSLRLDKSPASGTNWRSISWDLDNAEAIRMGINGSNYFVLWDAPQNVIPFEYRPTTKEVRIGSGTTVNILGESNLLKTTGGTMTGEVVLNSQATLRQQMPKTASARGFRYQDDTTSTYVAGLGFYRSSDTDKGALYMGWGETPWSQGQSLSVGENVFKYKGKDIAFADKNGLVNLTLTADATADDVNFPVRATRRGNTVTLSGKVMLNAGAVGTTIANLPADMRPVNRFASHFNASDGTPVFIDVNPNGNILFNVKGKAVYMTITYVAD
ncbi:BppU family phage baseplate upper protein [Bacillus sp. F9_6S_D1_P_5]